jgi:HEAT repeat protein
VEALSQIKSPQVVKPLIAKLDDVDKDVRQVVVEALGQIKSPQVVKPLIAKLDDVDKDVRQVVVEALSWICQDQINRKLLSRDVDALEPFLDPAEEIDQERVNYAAAQLEISVEEVRMRYQTLAQQFGLRLNFTTDAYSIYGCYEVQ